MERDPWWKHAPGPYPEWKGPVGCKPDGGGCHAGRGRVGPMTLHRACHNKNEHGRAAGGGRGGERVATVILGATPTLSPLFSAGRRHCGRRRRQRGGSRGQHAPALGGVRGVGGGRARAHGGGRESGRLQQRGRPRVALGDEYGACRSGGPAGGGGRRGEGDGVIGARGRARARATTPAPAPPQLGCPTDPGDVIVQDHVPKVKAREKRIREGREGRARARADRRPPPSPAQDFFQKPCWAHHPPPHADFMAWRAAEDARLAAEEGDLLPGA